MVILSILIWNQPWLHSIKHQFNQHLPSYCRIRKLEGNPINPFRAIGMNSSFIIFFSKKTSSKSTKCLFSTCWEKTNWSGNSGKRWLYGTLCLSPLWILLLIMITSKHLDNGWLYKNKICPLNLNTFSGDFLARDVYQQVKN